VRCDELRRQEKIFVTIGILLTVIICGGLYINHQLDRLVTAISRPGLLFVYPEDETIFSPDKMPGVPGTEASLPDEQQPGSHRPGDDGDKSGSGVNIPTKNNAPEGSNSAGGHLEHEITAAVQQKLDRPLEKKDLLKAGLVILRKLSTEEISYLYRIGTQDSYTREELQRVREILLAKLSPQEIRTLKEIGAKYGKQLRILDPDVQLK
jgi:hypothetical protein